LYGTYAKRSWSPDYLFGWKDEQWQAALDDIEHNWGTPQSQVITTRVPSVADDLRAIERIASHYRAAASPGAAAAIKRMNREIDVRHVLPVTGAPTLILHRTGDRLISVEHARFMAQHIPGAKLLEFSGENYSPWFGDRDAFSMKLKNS
jgi:pimeloyl-ACP methyl ester carboxylesterase